MHSIDPIKPPMTKTPKTISSMNLENLINHSTIFGSKKEILSIHNSVLSIMNSHKNNISFEFGYESCSNNNINSYNFFKTKSNSKKQLNNSNSQNYYNIDIDTVNSFIKKQSSLGNLKRNSSANQYPINGEIQNFAIDNFMTENSISLFRSNSIKEEQEDIIHNNKISNISDNCFKKKNDCNNDNIDNIDNIDDNDDNDDNKKKIEMFQKRNTESLEFEELKIRIKESQKDLQQFPLKPQLRNSLIKESYKRNSQKIIKQKFEDQNIYKRDLKSIIEQKKLIPNYQHHYKHELTDQTDTKQKTSYYTTNKGSSDMIMKVPKHFEILNHSSHDNIIGNSISLNQQNSHEIPHQIKNIISFGKKNDWEIQEQVNEEKDNSPLSSLNFDNFHKNELELNPFKINQQTKNSNSKKKDQNKKNQIKPKKQITILKNSKLIQNLNKIKQKNQFKLNFNTKFNSLKKSKKKKTVKRKNSFNQPQSKILDFNKNLFSYRNTNKSLMNKNRGWMKTSKNLLKPLKKLNKYQSPSINTSNIKIKSKAQISISSRENCSLSSKINLSIKEKKMTPRLNPKQEYLGSTYSIKSKSSFSSKLNSLSKKKFNITPKNNSYDKLSISSSSSRQLSNRLSRNKLSMNRFTKLKSPLLNNSKRNTSNASRNSINYSQKKTNSLQKSKSKSNKLKSFQSPRKLIKSNFTGKSFNEKMNLLHQQRKSKKIKEPFHYMPKKNNIFDSHKKKRQNITKAAPLSYRMKNKSKENKNIDFLKQNKNIFSSQFAYSSKIGSSLIGFKKPNMFTNVVNKYPNSKLNIRNKNLSPSSNLTNPLNKYFN